MRSRTSTWVVTGGSGTYTAARGIVAIRQIDDDRSAVNVARALNQRHW